MAGIRNFASTLGESSSSALAGSVNKAISFSKLEDILVYYATEISLEAQRNLDKPTQIRPKGANASGDLSASISVSPIKFMGGVYSIEITMLDYWKWVEAGRGPGKQPPLDKIIKWIKDKQLRLDDRGRTKKGYKREGTLLSKSKKRVIRRGREMSILEARARSIAEKIGKYGTQPTNFLTDAISKYKADLLKDAGEALKKDMIIIIKETTKLNAK